MYRSDPDRLRTTLEIIDVVYDIWINWYSFVHLPLPVRFSLCSAFVSFLVLLIMPVHPLAVPASFGAGIAINLVSHFTIYEITVLRQVLKNRTQRA